MRRMEAVRGWAMMAALLAGLGGAAMGQTAGGGRGGANAPPLPPGPPSSVQDRIGDLDSQPNTDAAMREQLEKARNDDRQKRLVSDTDKLLALATELKTDVDKTNKNTMSIDVIKKADEIEKLAHSVKEKMKGS